MSKTLPICRNEFGLDNCTFPNCGCADQPVTGILKTAASLLPCPFCGGRAEAGRSYSGETTLFKVQCMSCPAAMKGYDQSEADAIEGWNTRAVRPQSDAQDIEMGFIEACDEAGCAYDNEALLKAIADLKAARTQCDAGSAQAKLQEIIDLDSHGRYGRLAREALAALASPTPVGREALESSQKTLETIYRMNTHGSVHEFDWENGGVGGLIRDQIEKNRAALSPKEG